MKPVILSALLAALLCLGAAGPSAAQDQQPASAAPQSVTGVVSDAMCGAKHEGDAKACTLKCVGDGGQWALVVGDKVYTLTGKVDGLKDFAGGKATVTGKVDEDAGTIEVASVAAAGADGA